MAFHVLSQAAPQGHVDPHRPSAAFPFASLRKLFGALAAVHRRRLDSEVARFVRTREEALVEPGHALSWRFGVPVR